ncbi:MAG: aspartate aminotransferase family protein [Nitrospirae bacterium]|nr:aspartate aminotransferase family protein [Nitrospirota bacterium]
MTAYSFNLAPRRVERVDTRHRRIVTAIPVPESLPIIEQIARYESSNVRDQLPVVWDRAKGYQVFDAWGNAWIDFSSTIFVTNAGHGHPHIVKAIQEQSEQLLHSYSYPTEIRARYLKKLVEFTPPYLDKASLFSTGTEATERAVKLARLYGRTRKPVRKLLIGSVGNFHGKTMGAQMIGGQHDAKAWIGHHDPHMVHMPFPYPWLRGAAQTSGAELFRRDVARLLKKGHDARRAAAFVVESFQGWGAVFYPEAYIQEMRRFSRDHGALLIFDEVQAGFGRTGRLFCFEHYGVEPDLVICGKGTSSSVPLSFVLGRGDLIDLDPAYTSTHGGHPIACAAGLANLEVFERENLVAESARKGKIIEEVLARWKERFPKRIGRFMGKGMLWAVYFTQKSGKELDVPFVDRVVERALEKGVFSIRTGRGTLKLGPPLNMPDDALLEGLQVYEEAISEIDGER